MQRYEKNLTWPKDLSIFFIFPQKKKESQLAPAFKKEKYNENCKTLSKIQRYLQQKLKQSYFICCGRRNCTNDLQLMRLASYYCSIPQCYDLVGL